MKYQLTVNEKQAQVIWEALELYSRIHMGQWEEIASVSGLIKPGMCCECRDDLRAASRKYECVPSGGGYYGIMSDSLNDNARIAWDIQQVVRHRLSWDRNPKGGWGVNFDSAFQSCLNHPLAKIQEIK